MDNLATQNGVKADGDVAADVQNQRSHADSGVSNDRNTVISSGESAGKEYKNLQSEHEQGNKNFNDAKNAEDKRQSDKLGDNSMGRKELNDIKDGLQERFKKE